MRQIHEATFGVWYTEDGGRFGFVRWLKSDEVDAAQALNVAAQVFLDAGGHNGNELKPGRYMIQATNRGVYGPPIQCVMFDAVPRPQPLRAVMAVN